jgi:hypothetical protein
MRKPTIVLAILLIAVPALMATKSWMIQTPPLRAHSIPQTSAPLVPARQKFARP